MGCAWMVFMAQKSDICGTAFVPADPLVLSLLSCLNFPARRVGHRLEQYRMFDGAQVMQKFHLFMNNPWEKYVYWINFCG